MRGLLKRLRGALGLAVLGAGGQGAAAIAIAERSPDSDRLEAGPQSAGAERWISS